METLRLQLFKFIPICYIGIGSHYYYDRYYIYHETKDAKGISALSCDNPPDCGNGEATNGCYVKYRCGESTPYDAKSIQKSMFPKIFYIKIRNNSRFRIFEFTI